MNKAERIVILGPPGTGKTATLLKLVEAELGQGTSPDRIGYFAYTRRASTEAKTRAVNKFNIEDVLLENQPCLKNPTMKSIQMILYSHFLSELIDKNIIKKVELINARNKLKAYKGEPINCDIKNKYKKTKYLAIKYCEKMIIEDNQIFIDLFNTSKKQDDLSDSYLQAIYYINLII